MATTPAAIRSSRRSADHLRNARDRILSGYQSAAKNAPIAVARAQQELEAARAAKNSAKIAQAQDQLGRAQMNAKMVELPTPRSLPTLT